MGKKLSWRPLHSLSALEVGDLVTSGSSLDPTSYEVIELPTEERPFIVATKTVKISHPSRWRYLTRG